MSGLEISRAIDELLVARGALGRLNDGRRELGAVAAFHNRTFDVTKAVPTVVLRNEDYGRLARLVEDGRSVEIELSMLNRVYPEGRTAYNAIAEIEGSDKKNEVVMIGGHLDSWHSATGATDNAIGCATMMEVAAHLQGARHQAPSDHSSRAVERRGAGAARFAGVRDAALRIGRVTEV